MEARLGRKMPPSYREFLRVSDGWRHAGQFVVELAGTGAARWHQDAMGLGKDFDEAWGEEGNPEEVRAMVGLWSRALQLDVESDAVFVLLDPEDVGPDGEWAVRVWAYWRASDPQRYPSFAAYMVDMHREFHSFANDDREGRAAFVNETTRTQDAAVAVARTAALRGRHEEAVRLLTEAAGYGRPYAADILHQLRLLSGERAYGRPMVPPGSPRFLTELLPLHAAEVVESGRSLEGSQYAYFTDPNTFPDTARAAVDIWRLMGTGDYRYQPGGAFGRAVDEAHAAARWGDTDTAWRILRAAIPLWEPLDPDHLAPVGLLADPVLAPILTPARRTELLATPRGDESGTAHASAEPTADLDPGGLSWLVREGGLRPGNPSLSDFRMVLVEGVAPDELPVLLGESTGTPLSPPLHRWKVRRYHRMEEQRASVPQDRALLRVGRAGAGWSFGFEEDPAGRHSAHWFRSPAPAASSRGGRAIVVWGGWSWDTLLFHLSVAEAGDPLFEYTVRDGIVETETGSVPPELAPASLGFSPPSAVAPHEPPKDAAAHTTATARALDALAEMYGIRLPRHALTEGLLRSFESVSWVREPRDGDSWVTLRFE
ncbi:hypothetical protein HNQ79_006225 [Streptomyces candidus]|uniref:SMI1/KNR4 family protein n=2 Tax=Streptomyces candidus TaxID=67283 RepID=A0A7X0HLL0_9ACTN|nr:SMI1/KNR4 family protein [Streptomyces candidus]MBB6439713.1 hypothetical protein [Streptomyces candidus]